MILLNTLFKAQLDLLSSLLSFIIKANTILIFDGYYSFIVFITNQKYLISTVANISSHILINLMNLNPLKSSIHINPTIQFINPTDSTTSISNSHLRNLLQLLYLFIATDHLLSSISYQKIGVFVSSTIDHFFLVEDCNEIGEDYYRGNVDGQERQYKYRFQYYHKQILLPFSL